MIGERFEPAMPATLRKLQAGGSPISTGNFDSLDCLESRSDFELLMELLSAYSGSDGRPAKMTLNTVMGNPDFDAIRRDGFANFHHEHFFRTYDRIYGDSLEDLWNSAYDSDLAVPQFHAREHLNSRLWLRDLREDRPGLREAFDLEFFAVRNRTSSPKQSNYLAAYWCESQSEVLETRRILMQGLEMFEETFGFRSSTMVPCNYIFPLELEEGLTDRGVSLIQGQRGQAVPAVEKNGDLTVRRRHTGQFSRSGQRYSVRNVVFEPYKDITRDWVGSALRSINLAFKFRRPAIIATHRINYVSGLDVGHRDNNLRLLRELLSAVIKRWPDVCFASSDDIANMITDEG